MNDQGYDDIRDIIVNTFDECGVTGYKKRISKLMSDAYRDVDDETYQAMEAFIHNLNTMHSRAGRSTTMVDVPETWETLCPAV